MTATKVLVRLPTRHEVARPRLAGHHSHRASAPSAYREGDSGETVGQGESLATSAHPLV